MHRLYSCKSQKLGLCCNLHSADLILRWYSDFLAFLQDLKWNFRDASELQLWRCMHKLIWGNERSSSTVWEWLHFWCAQWLGICHFHRSNYLITVVQDVYGSSSFTLDVDTLGGTFAEVMFLVGLSKNSNAVKQLKSSWK